MWKRLIIIPVLVLYSYHFNLHSQGLTNDWKIIVFTGTINYQGDLKPNSFTFSQSNPTFKLIVRKPLNHWSSFRAGIAYGHIEGADKENRHYLKERNLSFHTDIKEVFAALELNMLDLSTKNFTPYVYGGVSVFHFNPWAYDKDGKKTFLKPLSTEGQGLPEYPSQKPYKLTQPALAFGVGGRYRLNKYVNIGIEFSQRKTFFDHLDDVSTFYVDKDILMAARGPKAVEMAFRGYEVIPGLNYPPDREQRGTHSEMDWYYYFGFTMEFKLTFIKAFLAGWRGDADTFSYFLSCPKVN